MRQAAVYRNGKLVGHLTERSRTAYSFIYDKSWLDNPTLPAVSLTIPKTKQEHQSKVLFPFFFNMLSEGRNRRLQTKQLRIDEEDSFGLLLETAQYDTVGVITVKPVEL